MNEDPVKLELKALVSRFETSPAPERRAIVERCDEIHNQLLDSGLAHPLGSEYELDPFYWGTRYTEFVDAYRLTSRRLLKDLERAAYACLVQIVGVDSPPGPKTRARILKRLKGRTPFSAVSFYGVRGSLPIGSVGIILLSWLPPWILFPLPDAAAWMPVVNREGSSFVLVNHDGASYLPPELGAVEGTLDGFPTKFVPLEQMERFLSVSQSWFSPVRALLAWGKVGN